ncbi:MAG: hypothetical protein V8R52_07470 [Coprobacter fastidiosus]
MMSAGKAQPTETTIALPNRLSSFFGRINYSALDRYLATKVSAPMNNRWIGKG